MSDQVEDNTKDEDFETENVCTALALNTQEEVENIQKEVEEEFITSDREVYKEGLRSLLVQEQKYRRQIIEIERDIDDLKVARVALDDSFKNGTLHSVEDMRGIVRTVRS